MGKQVLHIKILIRNRLIRCELCEKQCDREVEIKRNDGLGEGVFQPDPGQHPRMLRKDRMEEVPARSRAAVRLYHKEGLLGFAMKKRKLILKKSFHCVYCLSSLKKGNMFLCLVAN